CFSSRRRHTRSDRDWSSDVCSSDLIEVVRPAPGGCGFYRLRSPAEVQASLRFDSIQPLAGGQIALNFGASANQSCTLEFTANFRSEERRVGKAGSARGELHDGAATA